MIAERGERKRRGTHEGHVAHAKHDHSLVLGCVFGNAPKVRLDDVVPIQERHLAVGLYPDLGVAVSA
jgi:hypothetical protein